MPLLKIVLKLFKCFLPTIIGICVFVVIMVKGKLIDLNRKPFRFGQFLVDTKLLQLNFIHEILVGDNPAIIQGYVFLFKDLVCSFFYTPRRIAGDGIF